MGSGFQHNEDISSIELDRRVFRRKQTLRSGLISFISFAVFAFVIWYVLAHSEGWALVQKTYFNPEMFIESLPKVWHGLLLNIRILGFAVIGVGSIATLLAIVRTTRSPVLFPLRVAATAYTSIFRGLPLIIVLYTIGFGIPALGLFGRIPAEVLGAVSITLVYSAYVSEVIRAGIEAVHPSQRMAARSLGFSHARTMRTIILPQAIRKVIPALMNDFVAMQKDVGLVSILGAVDAVREAQKVNAITFNYTPYVTAGALFILMSFPFIMLTDYYSRKMRAREQNEGTV
ncbi:MAG: amino acid ABC transporter permease [Clostridiales Family XIII bacterium]|jgi:polar amino acid transport system permease protein|nr:amino acid ABC transporter permease [Clostridiales Family XIII bacterium]